MGVIILGIGNPIMGDDSIGPRVARSLQKIISLPEITICETSSAGLDILNLIAEFDKAIVVDAVQTQEGKPGNVYRLSIDQIVSRQTEIPHEIDIITALELGRKTGAPLPDEIIVYGIEVSNVNDVNDECASEVMKAVPLCVSMIIKELNLSDR